MGASLFKSYPNQDITSGDTWTADTCQAPFTFSDGKCFRQFNTTLGDPSQACLQEPLCRGYSVDTITNTLFLKTDATQLAPKTNVNSFVEYNVARASLIGGIIAGVVLIILFAIVIWLGVTVYNERKIKTTKVITPVVVSQVPIRTSSYVTL